MMECKNNLGITKEELEELYSIARKSIEEIYEWKKTLDRIHLEKNERLYRLTIFPIMAVAQDLKVVRNRLEAL